MPRHAHTTKRTKDDEYVAADGKICKNLAELRLHEHTNNLQSRMSKLPTSSHDADVATSSAANVEQTSKLVLKSHDGEEMFVRDLQFGSIDWSTLRPRETEEDSISTTSTIDYDYEYTDEEYPSTTDDEDNERLTDAEVKKVMSYLDSQLGSTTCESRDEWPDMDEWVASWKEVPPPSSWTWVNVFAYYNKKKGYGGYGVILRNAVAKPIIASAKFSNDGKSFFYQVFMGIKAGVDLAEKYGRCRLSIHCNSLMIPELFDNAPCCYDNRCRDRHDLNYICKRCHKYFSSFKGWNKKWMVPLIVELRGKSIEESIEELESAWSAAAHYLAKREKKKKSHAVEKKDERTAPYDDKPGDMVPDKFPPELKNILWREAFASSDFMAMQVEDPM